MLQLYRNRFFIVGTLLCSLSLTACKPGIFRPFKKGDQSKKKSDPVLAASTSSSSGSGSTSPDAGTGHARSDVPESSAPAIPEGPVSLIPISDQVSKNLLESLRNGVPKGVDCSNPTQAASIDCDHTLKSALQKVLFPYAFASSNTDYVMSPDRSITRSQLIAKLEKNDPLRAVFQKISSMHFFSNKAGWLFQDFEFVIAFSNQTEIWARGNSDVKLTCDTISSLFPKDGKDFFKMENVDTGEIVSLESPTHGKFCSADSLSKYRVVNLEVSEGFKSKASALKAPSLVVLLAREETKMPSYLVQIGTSQEKDFWRLMSAQIFSNGVALKK